MTQLRIRKKEVPIQPRLSVVAPMAGILLVGALTSFTWQGGRAIPYDIVRDVTDQVRGAQDAAKLNYCRTQTFRVDERDWVMADHPSVSFSRDELLPQGQLNGWSLVANRQRGLETLSSHARPFDRLYVDLGNGQYAPLRWRVVP